MAAASPSRLAEAALVAGALLMRVLVGLGGYSGASDPPKYGDYEAQRHWMEIALNLPPRQWYDEGAEALARLGQRPASADDHVSSSSMLLLPRHWPLDYPPLSGYQSWLTGLVVRAVDPAAVALGVPSRGYESPASKAAMRLTVLMCDAAVFFPAAFWAAAALTGYGEGGAHGPPDRRVARRRLAILAVLLLNPALVLIDHGHFQYNCVSLGLALAAMAALLLQGSDNNNHKSSTSTSIIPPPRVLASAVLFTLALCHKQMALYYAPAFFAHMLGVYCLQRQRPSSSSSSSSSPSSSSWPLRSLSAVAVLGAVVVATGAAAFLPVVWQHREGVFGGVLAVLSRIFPLGRGLYEDYVANFWCATSVGPVKWRELLPGATAARVALAATVLAALPSMAEQVFVMSMRTKMTTTRTIKPSSRYRATTGGDDGGDSGSGALGFLLCCANSAAAFFLFSFQVHEKSVLLPLMPATLLVFAGGDGATRKSTHLVVVLRAVAMWGPVVACFGMFPLLERDGTAAAYAACIAAYVVVAGGLVDEALRPEEEEEEEEKEDDEGDEQAPPKPFLSVAGPLATAAAAAGALVLHAARLLYEPPARLPWLHDRLFVTYAFLFIASATAYLNWLQWGAGVWVWGGWRRPATTMTTTTATGGRRRRPSLDDADGRAARAVAADGRGARQHEARAAAEATGAAGTTATATRRSLRQRGGGGGG